MNEYNLKAEKSSPDGIKNDINANSVTHHSEKKVCYNQELMDNYSSGQPIMIPQSIYDCLPKRIKDLTDTFDPEDPSRAVSFLTLLTHYSAISYNIKGSYHSREYYPNLFCYIVGEAASGKGNAIYARDILALIDKYTIEADDNMKGFIVAGNNSRAMLLSRIHGNNGVGIISETEGDALSVNYKSDWGNSSSDHRCCFQNERISMERATDKTVIVIDNPRYAMSITMTPGQVASLVGNRENGLFSRILFYTLDRVPEFTSPQSGGDKVDRSDVVKFLQQDLLEWYKRFENSEHTFVLSDEQWQRFTEFWQCRYNVWTDKYGNQESDLIFRLGLSSFKVAMTLHTISLENPTDDGIIQCNDEYLDLSLNLCEILFYHALKVADVMSPHQLKHSYSIDKLLAYVPTNFSTSEYIEASLKHGISERTAKRHLHSLLNSNAIVKFAHGAYKKNI